MSAKTPSERLILVKTETHLHYTFSLNPLRLVGRSGRIYTMHKHLIFLTAGLMPSASIAELSASTTSTKDRLKAHIIPRRDLTEEFPVESAVINRFSDVMQLDVFRRIQIRDGARDL